MSSPHTATARYRLIDRMQYLAFGSALAGLILALYLGFGVGAYKDGGESVTLVVTGGDADTKVFNWLLATIGFGPFFIGAAIFYATSMILESHANDTIQALAYEADDTDESDIVG